MQEQYGDQVAVVGIAGRDEVSAMEAFVSDLGVGAFPHIANEDLGIWSTYEVRSQPAFVFINDDGSYETVIGAMGESGLTSMIDDLLAT